MADFFLHFEIENLPQKTTAESMTTPCSNGPIEGHINRLKANKRQMYGRAGFGLLNARVLPWDASSAP
jgi:hypothetical protein